VGYNSVADVKGLSSFV